MTYIMNSTQSARKATSPFRHSSLQRTDKVKVTYTYELGHPGSRQLK